MHPRPHDDFHEDQAHAHYAPPGAVAPRSTEVTHTSNSQEERRAKIDMGMQQLRGYTAHGGKLFHSSSSKA